MSEISVLKALNTALYEELASDEKVICMGEDIGKQGGCWGNFTGLQDKFGEDRVIEFPIVEAGYSLMACGTAMMGYRPVVEYMFADFSTLGFEAIVDVAAKFRYTSGGKGSMPVTFLLPQGGCWLPTKHPSAAVSAHRLLLGPWRSAAKI